MLSLTRDSLSLRCDIFCTVIDNYGDLGVCWRLARHLAEEHAVDVTLIVDDLCSFQSLAPTLNPALPLQTLGLLAIRHWQPDTLLPAPADLVIEAFACTLPASYVQAMQARGTPPIWINLEYLSAETWVDGYHRLDSVQPQTGLIKTFWFPGFSAGTGGLLRSSQELAAMQRPGLPGEMTRQVSLFGYEQAGIASLLDALAADARPTVLNVFAGRSLPDVSRWLGHDLAIGDSAQHGALSIRVLPLLDHADYDRLLARCDLNLVRGEDSFVRAQWAGEAMLLHIYPQDEGAHLTKLAAWRERVETVAAAAGTPMPVSWGRMLTFWNATPATVNAGMTADWTQFLTDLPDIRTAMQSWRQSLLAQPDLATQLMRFYADRVESRPK